MSILVKDEILESIKNGEINFHPPLDKFQVKNHSIDLRLGFTFLIPKDWHVTVKGRESLKISSFDTTHTEHFDVIELEDGQFFDLLPKEFVIVSTLEKIAIPNNLTAILYPRSSINRRGLSLQTGAVHSCFEGHLTLPMQNNTSSQTIRLYPGERICQLMFEKLSKPISGEKSKYHKSDIADGPKKEKSLETNLILKGKIKELKEKYRL